MEITTAATMNPRRIRAPFPEERPYYGWLGRSVHRVASPDAPGRDDPRGRDRPRGRGGHAGRARRDPRRDRLAGPNRRSLGARVAWFAAAGGDAGRDPRRS